MLTFWTTTRVPSTSEFPSPVALSHCQCLQGLLPSFRKMTRLSLNAGECTHAYKSPSNCGMEMEEEKVPAPPQMLDLSLKIAW